MSDHDPTDDIAVPAPPPYFTASLPYAGSPSTIELTPEPSIKKRRRWPLAVGIAAILALAVGVMAVATRGDGREVLTLAEAAQKTQSQHTARVEFTTNMPIAGLAATEVLATGEIDFDKHIVHYSFDITEALKKTTSDVPAGAGKITAASHGLTIYMNLAVFDEVPSLKGKWMKMDVGQAVAAFGVDLDKVAELETTGPVSALAKLQSLSDTVDDLGKEDVRGVSTTHYRATYDFEKVYRARGAVTDEAAFGKLLDLYSSTTATTEAWVDHDGLVRRTVNVIPLKAGVQTVKAEFFDFGAAVNTQLPSDADTYRLEDLQSLIGGK
jgi:hypothetical protein